MYDSIRNRSNNTNITVSFRFTNTPTITPNTHPQQHLLFLQTSNTQAFLTITHLQILSNFHYRMDYHQRNYIKKTSPTLGHICVTQYELCSNTRPTDLTNIINVVCCLLPRNIHITHNNFWGYSKSQRIPCRQEIEYLCTPYQT